MGKRIRYARVSTRAQDTDRQITDLLGARVRSDDLYTDKRVSGAQASRPGFNKALEALQEGATLVITILDWFGPCTANMLNLAKAFWERGIWLQQRITNSQIDNARRLINAGQPVVRVARDLGMSRATLYRRIT